MQERSWTVVFLTSSGLLQVKDFLLRVIQVVVAVVNVVRSTSWNGVFGMRMLSPAA